MIPRIVHYVFGMASDFGGKPWGLVHHACLLSAIEHIKPDQVMFHYEFEPRGPWWALSRPLVVLMPRQAPTEIFGRPLLHVAHRAGVVRLQSLIRHGGIYMDADVLVQRSFDDLLAFPTVMGREGENSEYGMADAVILSEPGSAFLQQWLDEYSWFRSKGRDEFWAEHAVEVPSRLAQSFPQDVHILPYTAFFWPLWTDAHIRWIYDSVEPVTPGAYAHHLWEARAWKFFDGLTPGQVRHVDSNFHRWLRPYVAMLPDKYGAPGWRRKARKVLGRVKRYLVDLGSTLRSSNVRH